MAPLIYWLAQVARRRRRLAEVTQLEVAHRFGRAESAINHFEKTEKTPFRVERIIDAYAEELGIDPAEIWEEAVRLWREEREQG